MPVTLEKAVPDGNSWEVKQHIEAENNTVALVVTELNLPACAVVDDEGILWTRYPLIDNELVPGTKSNRFAAVRSQRYTGTSVDFRLTARRIDKSTQG